jgi:hypothetical protein
MFLKRANAGEGRGVVARLGEVGARRKRTLRKVLGDREQRVAESRFKDG